MRPAPRPIPRPSRPRAQWTLRLGPIALLAALTSQYLGAVLFLWSFDLAIHNASPLTLLRFVLWFPGNVDVLVHAAVCSLIGLVLTALTAVPVVIPRRRSLHGDARFASRREIADAGLLGPDGIILGRFNRRCLMLAGQQGVALAAPPRAGKGIGIVIPNALNWPGSLLCIDIKRENWTLTAGYRARCGQACYLFDPFADDGRTARWNPFAYVAPEVNKRINDIQRIAEMLYPDPPTGDPFWISSARSLFLGIALYLFETPGLPRTVGEVLRQGMACDDEGFGHHWKRLIEGRIRTPNPLSPQCMRALYEVIDLAPVTASSIRKTFTSRLDLWLNPILDTATASNDFDLRELRRQPMSIYVGVNPDDLHRLRPVLNLFFQQAIGLQTRELPEHNAALKHPVMLLLDEFTALGRIPILAESISYLPGYNVRVVLVIQTPAQLRDVYGANAAETMLKSLAARVVFAPKDFFDAREISDELGFTTVKVKSLSKPLFSFDADGARKSRTQTQSEQRRALLLPQEVKTLGPDHALIFCEGLLPIRCRKIRYFEDRRFKARLLAPPAEPVPHGKRAPEGATAGANDAQPPTGALVKPGFSSSADESQHDRAIVASNPVNSLQRAATVADVERIDSLTLDDYAADFSQLHLPLDRCATEEDLRAATERFLESLRER